VAKSNKLPLRKRGTAMNNYLLGPVEDEGTSLNDSLAPSSDDVVPIVSEAELAAQGNFRASTKGKPPKLAARFDIDKLRPGEVVFVDCKPYPVKVKGGDVSCFFAIDAKTLRECVVDVRSKRAAGLAVQQVIVHWGMHQLAHEYQCTIFSDGCGSMQHVEKMCYQMGIDYVPIPVDDQSLNLAETGLHRVFDAARTTIVDCCGRIPSEYYREVVNAITVQDNLRASTASRNHRPPLAAWRDARTAAYKAAAASDTDDASETTSKLQRLDVSQLVPLGDILACRKKRGEKHLDLEMLAKTLSVVDDGSLVVEPTDDPSLRAHTVVHLGYLNDTQLAQKKLLKINNKGNQSVICNRNVRVLRQGRASEKQQNKKQKKQVPTSSNGDGCNLLDDFMTVRTDLAPTN